MHIGLKLIKAIIVYGLCLYYNTKVLLGLLLLCITQFNNKFWKVKDRSVPPSCLLDKEYGEHKYIKVNVSLRFFCCCYVYINLFFSLNISIILDLENSYDIHADNYHVIFITEFLYR